jgi:hydrogenase-4 component B
MSKWPILLGIAVVAVSGVPGLFLGRRSAVGQWLAAALILAGNALGLAGVGVFWVAGDGPPVALPAPVAGAELAVAVDGLSAAFLVPVFLVSLLGSVYGLGYWKQAEHPDNGRKLRLFYGLLTAGMALLLVARGGILFLFGWECMALAAFFLVTTEDDKPEARAAGWLYLAATHTASLCLFALFALLRYLNPQGSFSFEPVNEDALTPGLEAAVFVLALAGFGLKAGLMPLHVWLPSSHAAAPSHVSAIMSGVIIKMGVYGLLRVTSLFPHPPVYWGATVLALGGVSGVLGVAFALGQHDVKRLLAYHSIENVGIIVMGVGLALLGRKLGRDDWVVLGLAGALLHVWNHALFKALLFLGAGSVIHAVRTREVDQLGGLARAMPWTSLCFLVGAVAICGLPPLNGFVSEFLVYLGLFGTVQDGDRPTFIAAAFGAPVLALIGALALACFVKVYGAVFLGSPRSERAGHAHESGPSILVPMGVLAGCCFFIGLFPWLVAPALGQAVGTWAPELPDPAGRLTELAPLGWVSVLGVALLAALGLGWLVLRTRLRPGLVAAGPTWGCGYAAPTPRMQYTSSSFADLLVGLFGWALRPKEHRPKITGLFPAKTAFHGEVQDPVLDEAVLPAVRSAAGLFSWFRVFQQGSIQLYLLYVFLALLALLLWR